jgi:predicted metal-dependent enzyme (double-stranded beta helix superfamily)
MPRFDNFIQAFTRLIDQPDCDEARIFKQGKQLLSELVSHDDWLPAELARSSDERYQQYLLHCDPQQRFSVVSFVWGPGQASPIHDHTVWGMIGVLRGAETCEEFERDPASGHLRASGKHQMLPGQIDLVSPRIGDIHRVSNALADRPTLSIHVYGADIGTLKRHMYAAETGAMQDFISGYSTPGAA